MKKGKYIEIGNRIKELRGKNSRENFATKCGMSYQYLRDLENGNYCMSTDKLINICNFTGVSSDYILFGKGNDNDGLNIELLKKYSIKQLEDTFKVMEDISLHLNIKQND